MSRTTKKEYRDALCNLCRLIDHIEIFEDIDALGRLCIRAELTAELFAARDNALDLLRGEK